MDDSGRGLADDPRNIVSDTRLRFHKEESSNIAVLLYLELTPREHLRRHICELLKDGCARAHRTHSCFPLLAYSALCQQASLFNINNLLSCRSAGLAAKPLPIQSCATVVPANRLPTRHPSKYTENDGDSAGQWARYSTHNVLIFQQHYLEDNSRRVFNQK